MVRRRRGGFTLFEVMAAVIVLGLLYSLLASSAIGGLRAEGTSRRRLEASLLADQTLHELEGEIMLGALPEIGSREEELDDYLVKVDVLPFDPSPFLPEQSEERSEEAAPGLLDPPADPAQSLLRILEVTVSWIEGFDEHQVRRTTFGYDIAALAPLIGSPEAGEGSDVADDAEGGTPRDDGTGLGQGRQAGGDDKEAQIQKMFEALRNVK